MASIVMFSVYFLALAWAMASPSPRFPFPGEPGYRRPLRRRYCHTPAKCGRRCRYHRNR